jgi:hexokinase
VHHGCCCAAQTQSNGNGASGPPVIGFCFSFAVEQAALNSGKLLVWTKGFNVEGVIGKDVVQLLSGAHVVLYAVIMGAVRSMPSLWSTVSMSVISCLTCVGVTAVGIP